jgi:hypothetical protein
MSIFVEFKEFQFTVKGSKVSTFLSTVGFLKLPPAAPAAHRACGWRLRGFKSCKGRGRQEAMPGIPVQIQTAEFFAAV